MEKMEISQEGLALIKRFEGCSLTSYLCQANVPTIGFGSTRENAMRNSTLLKVLNNSEYQKVPSEMKRWNKVTVNGEKVVSDGLMRRREAESLLFKDEPWHEV